MAITPPIAGCVAVGLTLLLGCAPNEGYRELHPFAACRSQCQDHGDVHQLDFGRGLCVCGDGEQFAARHCDPSVSSCVSYLDVPTPPGVELYGTSADRARWLRAVRELEAIEREEP